MKLFDEHNFIHQFSIDCVILGYKDGALKVLVPKLDLMENLWALPGGFILQEEGIDQAALRILEERTGIRDIYLEQFRVFGEPNRINKEIFEGLNCVKDEIIKKGFFDDENLYWLTKRFISIGYYALVDINKVHPQCTDFDESIDWYNIKELPKLIMDHNEMVGFALETLRQNLDEKLIGFNLLPETFTMREVQELYEAVYDKPFARNNFQKKMLDLNVLDRLEKKFTGAANKAPFLYRFKKAGETE
ncbi:ADP-ribose pyrophosphatase YjhB (NUDIX family) [Arcicella aurantiaca]|uniref:ADP-ribose pyrophosphatase YjhB (NUDIX family) n=1 Tax=Arcicella aurantiaca TaxID=591202 RepID=A0A316EDZ7_9BACT|nr:NUDIX domain-containing protein [Arcicella aurantiaca]PWK27600.1 ADP-ribose pyrophosphatase YjhB (NUDIX family) [Arcicella aurantiaca]